MEGAVLRWMTHLELHDDGQQDDETTTGGREQR